MPRIKVSAVSKTAITKKKPIKKLAPAPKSKKNKKVMVDIIEDEDSSFLNAETTKKNVAERDEKIYKSLVTEKYEAEPMPEEFDSQKKFFSQLAKETSAKKTGHHSLKEGGDDKTKEARPAKHIGLYRKLVWKFLFATLILLGIVFYFSFSKLTINITPKGEVLNDSLFLKVSAADISKATTSPESLSDPRTAIAGDIKEINSSLEAVYPASGEEFGAEELIGSVKIINNNNKNQALVATTRVLSADNKLFRIKNAVNVPAGGEVSVDIYADKPSPEMAIGPTTFTIPGLWVGLQDKIFARSDKEFTYAKKVKKFVKQIDLENAAKDINGRLINNASSSLSDQNSNWFYTVSDKTKITYSAKAGDLVDQFSAKVDGNVIAVSFVKADAVKLVTTKLKLLVPDDKELIEFKPENIVYTLDSYDAATNSATIKASFSGTMALKADSTVVNRDQLVNLTESQIANYLKAYPEIKSYELNFFPSFIKRAPNLVDRINIVINKDK